MVDSSWPEKASYRHSAGQQDGRIQSAQMRGALISKRSAGRYIKLLHR
jgi:hypothetical protein